MTDAKMSVTALAAITGVLSVNKPNSSHSNVPKVNSEYIYNDMPDVSRVLMVLIAWGKKELVVHNAANKPVMVIKFIVFLM